MNLRRDILHYRDTSSDKVYIIEINQLAGAKPYVVVATWGKRNAPRLNSQIKEAFTSLTSANALADKLVYDKRRGKDAYQIAARGLEIPGLQQVSSIAALHAGAAPIITENQTQINIVADSPARRRIKL